MRISNETCSIIKETLSNQFGNVQIFLFGSRADDKKKGGDIDLFIQVDREVPLIEKLQVLAQLEKQGIERKVDLVIDTPKVHNKTISDAALSKGVPIV